MDNRKSQAQLYQYFVELLPYPGFLLLNKSGNKYFVNKNFARLLKFSTSSDFHSCINSFFCITSVKDSQRIFRAMEQAARKVTLPNISLTGKDRNTSEYKLTLQKFSGIEEGPHNAWIGCIPNGQKNNIPVENSILNHFYSDKFLDETALIIDFKGNILCSSREFRSIEFFRDFSGKELNLLKIIDESYLEILKRRLNELKKGVVMPPAEYKLSDTDNRPVFIEVHSRPIIYKGEKAILALVRDITIRKESERQLLYTVIQTEEKERQKFARDLHDDLGPFFSGLKLYINELQARRDDCDKSATLIQYLSQMIDEAVEKVRLVASNLTPQNVIESGLTETVRVMIGKFNLTGRIFISFETEGKETNIGSSFIITLYRIILELINNSMKHAGADKICIRLHYTNKSVRLIFGDNGKGFDWHRELKSTGGIGLKSIMNRIELHQGKFKFRNINGIHLSIYFPLK